MAEKIKPQARGPSQEPVKPLLKKTLAKSQKQGNMFKSLLIVFVLLTVLGAGFALGVYMNIIDIKKIAQTYKLHEYPVLSNYFPKPQTNFEPVPWDVEQPKDEQKVSREGTSFVPAAPLPATSEKRELDKAELEKQIDARKQEEAKKLSKLARLYGSMKPDEAVLIMNHLDDETVLAVLSRMEDEQVAKILALFEAKRAARLTREMLKVKPIISVTNS